MSEAVRFALVATHDYSLADQSGASFRGDLNNALSAIARNNDNSGAPATTFPFQWHVDTSGSQATLKIRDGANNAYIQVCVLQAHFKALERPTSALR